MSNTNGAQGATPTFFKKKPDEPDGEPFSIQKACAALQAQINANDVCIMWVKKEEPEPSAPPLLPAPVSSRTRSATRRTQAGLL